MVPEVDFDRLEISQEILTKDSVNPLAKALRNLREIVHGKELVVAPEDVANLECGFDRNGTADITGTFAGSQLRGRWESASVDKPRV